MRPSRVKVREEGHGFRQDHGVRDLEGLRPQLRTGGKQEVEVERLLDEGDIERNSRR